ELVRTLGLARAAGYANAVLRRISETRAPPPPPSRGADPIGHVAAVTAHPRWLVERWAKWLGLDETEKLCAANQQQAPAVLRGARGESVSPGGAGSWYRRRRGFARAQGATGRGSSSPARLARSSRSRGGRDVAASR